MRKHFLLLALWACVNIQFAGANQSCINYMDLNNARCYINNSLPQNSQTFNDFSLVAPVDSGYTSIASRHTVHTDTTETDPRTGGLAKTIPDGELGSIRLGNWSADGEAERIEYTFEIDTNVNPILILKYMPIFESPAHEAYENQHFKMELLIHGSSLGTCTFLDIDGYNITRPYSTISEEAAAQGWHITTAEVAQTRDDIIWKEWSTVGINLRRPSLQGEIATVRLTNLDCVFGAHSGYTYFTLGCSDGKIKDYWAGSDLVFEAPEGFAYRWIAVANEQYRRADGSIPEQYILGRNQKFYADDTVRYVVDCVSLLDSTCFFSLYTPKPSYRRVQIGDLYYNLDGPTNTAEVTYKSMLIFNYPNMETIVIPSVVTYHNEIYDVTSIGESAFNNCKSLTSVEIPNSITDLGGSAFGASLTSGLTSITCNAIIPPTATKKNSLFTSNPFTNVDKSIPIYVPAESVELYRAAEGWSEFTNILPIGGSYAPCVTASGYCGAEGDGTNLTWELSCDSVLTIRGTGAMANYYSYSYAPWRDFRDSILEVVINDGVSTIGRNAFTNCSQLTYVNLPNSIDSIGAGAFFYCSKLGRISIPNHVRIIEDQTFYWCSNLASVILPDSLKQIKSDAFRQCKKLKAVDIPNGVTMIDDGAFSFCSSLTSLTLPATLSYLGNAFYNCTGVTTFTCYAVTPPNPYPSSFTDAFDGIDKSIPLYVPAESVELYRAAEGWSEFTNILPIGGSPAPCIIASGYCGADIDSTNLTWTLTCDNVLTISGTGAMMDYYSAPWYNLRDSIRTAIIEDGVTKIGNSAFWRCSNLTSVKIPNSVTIIFVNAFLKCTGLTSIDIPDSVTAIANNSFQGCSALTAVVIPSGVIHVGQSAFSGCTSLQSVTCEAIMPPLCWSTSFNDVDKSIPLYVPAGSIELYRAEEGWSEFTNILPIGEVFNPEHPLNPGNYQLTLEVEDTLRGYAIGSGLYAQGTTVRIEAIAKHGYEFLRWSDNDTMYVRDIVLTRDCTLIASFTDYMGEETVYVYDADDITSLPIGRNTHVIVASCGRLIVSQPTAIRALTIYKDSVSGEVENINQLTADNIEWVQSFYGRTSNQASHWFAFGVPFAVDVATGIRDAYTGATLTNGVDFVIDEYDGTLRADTQDGWTRLQNNAMLNPAKLYMLASPNTTHFSFSAADPHSTASMTYNWIMYVNAYPSQFGDHHAGWNGIANPCWYHAYTTSENIQYATKYDNYYGVYQVVPLNNSRIWQAADPFFLQAPQLEYLYFVQKSGWYVAPRRTAAEQAACTIELKGTASNYADKAYIEVASEKENHYTIGQDLVKMQVSNPSVPQVWIEAYDMHLAAYTASQEDFHVSLGFYAPEEGTYTLQIKDVPDNCAILLTLDGQVVTQIGDNTYSLQLESGNNDGFDMQVYNAPTSLEQTSQESKTTIRKLIKDGQVLILCGDKIYTVTGQEVK